MNNIQTAIIYSSMLGSILNEFEKSPKAIMDLKMQVKKFMFKRSRTNKKKFIEAIHEGQKVWNDAINHYAKQNMKIDSFAIIVALWSSQSELLSKFVNLTQKRIDRFSLINDSELLEAELDAYAVASYINNTVNKKENNALIRTV